MTEPKAVKQPENSKAATADDSSGIQEVPPGTSGPITDAQREHARELWQQFLKIVGERVKEEEKKTAAA